MFSFHKPKVYRSSTGCCICKAKSSSSRFTDSKKYEEDFLECFQLSARRQGEICNACVLLVKRWKKLPEGPKRNWRHVVDARAGPGMKSMTKFKSKQKKQMMMMEHIENKRRLDNRRDRDEFEREFSPTLSDKSDDMDMDYSTLLIGGESPTQHQNGTNGSTNIEGGEMTGNGNGGNDSDGSSPRLSGHSPNGSDCEENNNSRGGLGGNAVMVVGSKRRKQASKALLSRRQKRNQISQSSGEQLSVFGFVDSDYWTKESICCGVVFRGQNGEVLVDVGRGCRLKPCTTSIHQQQQQQKERQDISNTALSSTTTLDTTSDSATTPPAQSADVPLTSANHSNGDNSSDSGYDDSSLSIISGGGSTVLVVVDQSPANKELTGLASVRRKPISVSSPSGNAVAVKAVVSSVVLMATTAVID